MATGIVMHCPTGETALIVDGNTETIKVGMQPGRRGLPRGRSRSFSHKVVALHSLWRSMDGVEFQTTELFEAPHD